MTGSELIWPAERPRAVALGSEWSQARSNVCLDFHGDPAGAQLAVFSDGNHHMALAECIETFVRRSPGLHDVFYTTTPPSVYLTLLKAGELSLGNLTLRVRPNVVIGPSDVVGRLHAEGEAGRPVPFARSRGNAFLVRGGNPKAIGGVSDLLRDDVIPFMSNPDTEAVSYAVYRDTILETARLRGLDVRSLERRLSGESGAIVFGERIHHREAPQAVVEGRADVAMVYYHLALRYARIFPGRFDLVCDHREAPQAVVEGRADVAMVYYHLALRYARICTARGVSPGAQDPAGDGALPPGMVVTEYAIAPARDTGEWGDAFVSFMRSGDAAAIYERYGLRAVGECGGAGGKSTQGIGGCG